MLPGMKEIPERSWIDLASAELFAGFSKSEIRELFAPIRAGFSQYHRGALISYRGDHYDRLLLLTRGELIAEIVDQKGVSLKVETLTGPTPVASAMLFAGEAVLPVQLRAETEAEVLSISRQGVLDLCSKDQRFLNNYLRDSGDKIAFLAEKLRLLRFTTIRQKIAVYFLELAERQGSLQLNLPHKLEIMADMFGVTRPALSRCLAQLVDEGMLDREGREYSIRDSASLAELVED